MSHAEDDSIRRRRGTAPPADPVSAAGTRLLWAGRTLGTAVLALLARHAVDGSGIALIRSFDVQAAASAATQVALALAIGAAVMARTGSRHTRTLASLALSLIIAAFVLTLPLDPLLSGMVIAWALYGFGRMFFDGEPMQRVVRRRAGVRTAAEAGAVAPAVRHLLLVSVVAGVSIVGFGFEGDRPALVTCQLLALVALADALRFLLPAARGGEWAARVALLLIAPALLTAAMPRVSVTVLVFAQLTALISLARNTQITRDLIDGLYDRPAVLLTASFVALILVGALLLAFPASSASGESIGFVDALFTATSATCVTGLIVLDTASDFSRFGQGVILLLIQVGGLNIMVLSTFAALLLGRGLGLRGERAVGDILDIETPGAARRLIAFIVLVTLAIEAIGTLGMAAAYHRAGLSLAESAWRGLFHAISAFCNAGFALQADSLVMFRSAPLPLLLMAGLIVLGGLGFAVLGAIWQKTRKRGLGHMAVQSRIVLAATLVLVVAGAVAFLLGEWSRSLGDLTFTDKLANALFQSVTLRTAGFNTVDMTLLQPVTVLWAMAFMFIGASPGGTGGGIKTTTAVVLFAAIPAFLRRRHQVVVGGRSISAPVVHQSASIAVASVVAVLLGAGLLMASQSAPFEYLLFEAVSAFGTVGLSLGVTPQLDHFGKVVIVLLMLIGRVGPLAITLLLARERASRVRYPEARIMVG